MKLTTSVTPSSLNGVQKLASAVISPAKRKIGGAIFVWLGLLLDAEQLFQTSFKSHLTLSMPSRYHLDHLYQ
ncbi:hydrolase [Enterococcus faecium]|nr:hydrolase [Enterococcus faecium]